MANREVKLPSGKKLVIQEANFEAANDLNREFMANLKDLDFGSFNKSDDVTVLLRHFVFRFLASASFEQKVWACMDGCTIDKLRLKREYFDDVAVRADYPVILMEVAVQNVKPFMKGLFAGLSSLDQIIASFQE